MTSIAYSGTAPVSLSGSLQLMRSNLPFALNRAAEFGGLRVRSEQRRETLGIAARPLNFCVLEGLSENIVQAECVAAEAEFDDKVQS